LAIGTIYLQQNKAFNAIVGWVRKAFFNDGVI
jgi:hypothetical protein